MASTRTGVVTAIRVLLLSTAVLVGAAAAAQAAPLTLNFAGSVDLSGIGGSSDTQFSGFFTWDPAKTPFMSDPPYVAIYEVEEYQLIFGGVDVTAPGPGGAGVFVVNDANAFGTGDVDALFFGTEIEENVDVGGIIGDLFLVLAFSGPTDVWDTISLPTDYSFLSKMTTSFSGVSLEVPGEDDENDIRLGEGSFEATPVPEPATLTLGALGLAGVLARARRGRQRRDQ